MSIKTIDQKYFELAEKIISEGFIYEDPNRAGINRLQIPHYTLDYDFLSAWELPLLSTKKLSFKSAVGEFVTFIKGDNTLKGLKANGVNFWDKDAYRFYDERWGSLDYDDFVQAVKDGTEPGNLGKIYPYHMRKWNGYFDQILDLIDTLLNNPLATKKTVTMWNPTDNDDVALTPCHHMFEILVTKLENDEHGFEYGLRTKFSMGSVDVFLGLPYNIAYYSIMTHFLAHITGMKPLGIIASLSNVHIYEDHLDAIKVQLKRNPTKNNSPLLGMTDFLQELSKRVDAKTVLDLLQVGDFYLTNYHPEAHIWAEMFTYTN